MEFEPSKLGSSPFVVGATGAMITALKFTPGASWLERLINVVAGSAVAGFGAPAIVDWLHMSTEGYKNGCAFVVGLLGMSVIAAVLQALRDLKLAEIVSGWISRRP